MDRVMALIAFVCLGLFVGILIWHVTEIDLIAVVAITVALVAFDFVTSNRGPGA